MGRVFRQCCAAAAVWACAAATCLAAEAEGTRCCGAKNDAMVQDFNTACFEAGQPAKCCAAGVAALCRQCGPAGTPLPACGAGCRAWTDECVGMWLESGVQLRGLPVKPCGADSLLCSPTNETAAAVLEDGLARVLDGTALCALAGVPVAEGGRGEVCSGNRGSLGFRRPASAAEARAVRRARAQDGEEAKETRW